VVGVGEFVGISMHFIVRVPIDIDRVAALVAGEPNALVSNRSTFCEE
jgi:hypothetical protein